MTAYGAAAPTVVAVIGRLARTLVTEIATAVDGIELEEVDLQVLGAAVLDWSDPTAGAAVKRAFAANVLAYPAPPARGPTKGC